MVVARADAVEDRARDLGADGLSGPLDHVELQEQAAPVDLEGHRRLVGPQPPLDDVARDAAVHPEHGVAGAQTGGLGRGTGRDSDDEGRTAQANQCERASASTEGASE